MEVAASAASAIFASTVESAGLLQEARTEIKRAIKNFVEDFIFFQKVLILKTLDQTI